jgi:hypothetical protein
LFHVEFGFDVRLFCIWIFNKNKVLDNDVDVFSFLLDLIFDAGLAVIALRSFQIVFRFSLLVFTCAQDFDQVVELLRGLEAVDNDEAIV